MSKAGLMKEKHQWAFASRFRARAFGWKSQPAIGRIREAVSEIKKVARKDALLGAQGAVLFIEKVSASIEQVDGSSGAIGTAVNNALAELVPLIARAPADDRTRDGWLERLWEAHANDTIPYIESLADYWGELCATPERASRWADRLLSTLLLSWKERCGYFHGTDACLSSLLAAGRLEELLALIETAPHVWWNYRKYGVQALAAMGRVDEAITYAEQSLGLNDGPAEMARACEQILLSAGRADEAYRRYAITAHPATSRLATYRAIAKKYPQKNAADILADLVESTPGDEGKWFATARELGLYQLALDLANHSPCDPKTLNRAARDHRGSHPAFAMGAAAASLRWIALGHGWEISGLDVLEAYGHLMEAARAVGQEEPMMAWVREVVANDRSAGMFVQRVLGARVGVKR